MRHTAVRALAGGAALLLASGALAGCGLLGDNSDEVCAGTKTVLQQYMTQVRTVSANDPAQWKKSTERVAGRVEELSRQAENEDLKKALKTEADRFRAAAAKIGTGDAAPLNSVIAETPQRIGNACD
jgi:hypothetical protein